MNREITETAARTAALAAKSVGEHIDALRIDERIGGVNDGIARLERKLGGLGSTVGSLASLQRTSKAPPARRADPGLTIVRACLAKLWAYEYGKDPADLAAEVYGAGPGAEVQRVLSDPAAWVQKATTNPAMTTVAGWAAELLDTSSNVGVIRTVAPQSAYTALTGHGARLSITGNASVRLINRASAASGSFFRAEGSPLPVRAMSFGSSTARTYGGGFAVILSGELLRRSSPNAETVLRTAMAEDASLEIDSIMLGSAAGTATQPPGLLYNAVPVAPASVVARDTQGAAMADVSGLIAAIPGISDPVYIARREVVARLLGLVPGFAATTASLIISPYVPAASLTLIDGDDLWSAESDNFQIDSTFEASVVSANPALPQVDGAGVVGAPDFNMFQQDLAAIRILVDLGWGMRQSGRAATVSPVAW